MTNFPIDTVIFNKIVEVFNQTRSYVLLLFPLAFFIRIALGFILLKSESFTDILKDSLFLFLGLFFFTDILKMTLQIPYFVSSELSMGDWRDINLGEGLFINFIRRIVDWIGIVSYWISFGLYIVIVSALGFFAGYILFFGTMFRAYGILKVFFILLLTVSLWPLLWYSINFAVYTVAVSDNALANNVIIGGASLAKMLIPLWLISKASKVPVAQALKKASITGGNLAYAGGSYAYSTLNNTNNNLQSVQNEKNTEENNEEAEINIEDSVFQENKDAYINKAEDFFIGEKEKDFLPERNIPEQENSLTFNKEDQSTKENQENHTENNIENSTQSKQETHIENSPQVTNEIKETQNTSQSNNENTLSTPQIQSEDKKELSSESNKKIFNESVHKENWREDEHINSHKKTENTEKDAEL